MQNRSQLGPDETKNTAKVFPELTAEGKEKLFTVASSANDPVMKNYWPEIRERVLHAADELSDQELTTLLNIPEWLKAFLETGDQLPPIVQARVNQLRPRSTISRLLKFFNEKIDRRYRLPEGLDAVQAEALVLELKRGTKSQEAGAYIQLDRVSKFVKERFADLPEDTQRGISSYLKGRLDLEGTIE